MADEQAPKILIVDDDPLTVSWLRALLERLTVERSIHPEEAPAVQR